MALSVNAYATLAGVKEEVNIPVSDTSKDTYLEKMIEIASRRIDLWCNRTFHYEAAASLDFVYRNWPWIDLVKPNVIAITSITDIETSEVIPSDDYGLSTNRLYLKRALPVTAREDGGITSQIDYDTAFPRHRVVYEAGFETPEQSGTGASTLPIDIQFAAEAMVTDFYMNKGQNPRIKREHVLEAATWFDMNYKDRLMEAALAPYRRAIAGGV